MIASLPHKIPGNIGLGEPFWMCETQGELNSRNFSDKSILRFGKFKAGCRQVGWDI